MSILKKSLPRSSGKDLESIARSIVEKSNHWHEVDLNEHLHDETEVDLLHEICQRVAVKKPKKLRLFFKD